MSVCILHAHIARRGQKKTLDQPRFGIANGSELSFECGELDPDPLEEESFGHLLSSPRAERLGSSH